MLPQTGRTSVDKEPIENTYNRYRNGDYVVNRRYQRKLVWQTREKSSLIDTIMKSYPLPQFLFANIEADGRSQQVEIIDGLQRMNAILGFIENEFAWNGHYFDLSVISTGKNLVEEGKLEQKEPRLSGAESRRFLQYNLAISTYETTDQNVIEEVFRRINSTGQKLSAQDLRQAGSNTRVSELVRRISSEWRGDNTRDRINLSNVKAISISSDTNDQGIDIEKIFWVRHGIVSRQEIRSSADEQMVLDLVADMLFTNKCLRTSTPVRDYLYGRENTESLNEKTRERIDSEFRNPEWNTGRTDRYISRFRETMHRIDSILQGLEKGNFRNACGVTERNPVPRYFEALFTVVYRFLYLEHRDLSDNKHAAEGLAAASLKDHMKSGGEWTESAKEKIIMHLRQHLAPSFHAPFSENEPRGNHVDLTSAEFDSLTSGTLTEIDTRDVKQGFLSLYPKNRDFDPGHLTKIVKTLTAISNTSPITGGTILVGVADSRKQAEQIEEVDGVTSQIYRSMHIVGIEREAIALHMTYEKYIDRVHDKLLGVQQVNEEYMKTVVSSIRYASYGGLRIAVLTAPPVTNPVSFDGTFHARIGAKTKPVKQPDELITFMREFDIHRNSE